MSLSNRLGRRSCVRMREPEDLLGISLEANYVENSLWGGVFRLLLLRIRATVRIFWSSHFVLQGRSRKELTYSCENGRPWKLWFPRPFWFFKYNRLAHRSDRKFASEQVWKKEIPTLSAMRSKSLLWEVWPIVSHMAVSIHSAEEKHWLRISERGRIWWNQVLKCGD